MKTILSSRRDRYLARFSIFLITVALIAGMVGCTKPTDYELTISIIGEGNVTATVNEEETIISPGKEETISGIANSTEVNLVATPNAGYRFDRWTGDVDTIADVNAASTNITMNGRYSIIHYHITAEFAQGQEIRDWYGLNATRTPNNLGGDHILMNELNSTTLGWDELVKPDETGGLGWEPIETFTGSFDGKGYEIRDLFIDRPDKIGVGLFGYVGRGGEVQNVTVVNANVTGEGSVGGLVGENRGTVRGSNSTGSVIGTAEYVGGLVGRNYENSTVSNSYSSSNVNGSNNYVGGLAGWNGGTVSDSHSSSNVNGSNDYVGGLAGLNQGTVTNSYSTGSVSGGSWVGGLAGNNSGTVSNSTSTGSVSGDSWVGGLVGWNEGKVENNSHSSGNITGSNEYVGGLVGENRDAVSSCYSSGSVSGDSNVGGLVGWNEGTVSDSYCTGTANGTMHVGGLVGYNFDKRSVSSSYSTGNVIGYEYVGGLVGWNEGAVSDSYCKGTANGTMHVGGLVGYNFWGGSIKQSYSTGNVIGDSRVGGLAGWNGGTVSKSSSNSTVNGKEQVGGLLGRNEGTEATVSNSYSTGNVTGYEYVGGLVGWNEQGKVEESYSTGSIIGLSEPGGLVAHNSKGTVNNSFWDIKTSGQTKSDGGTPKTTAEMQDIATFLGVEWDIISVAPGQPDHSKTWNIVDRVTYPRLSWQP